MAEIAIGLIISILVAISGFFLVRLVGDFDKFKDETRRSFRATRQDVKRELELHKRHIEEKINESGFDNGTKAEFKASLQKMSAFQASFKKIEPYVGDMHELKGKIIMIENKMDLKFGAQEKKLKGLHDVIVKVLRTRPSGQ